MRTTTNLSFELEETSPGTFLLQGLLGGVVSGLVYTVALCLWEPPRKFINVLIWAPFISVFAGILGVLKSILMWIPYRFAKVQPGAVTRVGLTSIATSIFAVSIALLFNYRDPNKLTAWVNTLLVGGLPTAILVGSNVKPWELFAFGSIDEQRLRSVWGALGTLPLRFLSLLVFALWTLYVVCWISVEKWWANAAILVFLPPAFYLLVSAYLTFKSPHKVVLFVIGLVLNLPVGIVVRISYEVVPYRTFETPLYVFTISTSLLIAWLVFLIARLSVRTSNAPLSILAPDATTRAGEVEHHCLGSRFMGWQERDT